MSSNDDDVSSFSVDLEEASVRGSGEESSEASGSTRSSVFSRVGAELDAEGRISLLKKLRGRMEGNQLFDDQDVRAVTDEIERIQEQERNSLEAKLNERLRILAKFDAYLLFRTNHPVLNTYFLKKQKKMKSLAKKAQRR